MPRFTYLALAEDGSRHEGEIVAGGMEDLLSHLRVRRQYLIEVKERSMRPTWWERFRLRNSVGIADIAALSYQLATMIGAGLPIHETLGALSARARSRALRGMLRRVSEDIEAGNSFAGALGRYRDSFGDYFISIVKAGENSGQLDTALEHVAEQYDEEAQLRAEIQGILVYPILLAVMTLGVVTFLVTMILPRFVQHFETLGTDVPRITRMLLDGSSWVRDHRLLLAGGVLLLVVAGAFLLHVPGARLRLDGLALRLPLIGPLIQRREAARFAGAFSLLQASGVPLLASLSLCAEIVTNRRMAAQIRAVREGVEAGQTLEQAMRRAHHFPPDLARVVAVGEQTGRLATMVGRVGRAYDREVRRESRRLVTLIEPALILVLGLIVGFVALSLVVPMIRATRALHG